MRCFTELANDDPEWNNEYDTDAKVCKARKGWTSRIILREHIIAKIIDETLVNCCNVALEIILSR